MSKRGRVCASCAGQITGRQKARRLGLRPPIWRHDVCPTHTIASAPARQAIQALSDTRLYQIAIRGQGWCPVCIMDLPQVGDLTMTIEDGKPVFRHPWCSEEPAA